jgi:hypothetical protein
MINELAEFLSNNAGLILNIVGTILLAVSTQFGTGVAWGGAVKFKNQIWRLLNAAGWVLLCGGFLIQLWNK